MRVNFALKTARPTKTFGNRVAHFFWSVEMLVSKFFCNCPFRGTNFRLVFCWARGVEERSSELLCFLGQNALTCRCKERHTSYLNCRSKVFFLYAGRAQIEE